MIIMSSFHVASSVVVASSALDGLLRLAAMVIVGVEWHGWLATIVTATGEWRMAYNGGNKSTRRTDTRRHSTCARKPRCRGGAAGN